MIKSRFDTFFRRRKAEGQTGDAGVDIATSESSDCSNNPASRSVGKESRRWSSFGDARPSQAQQKQEEERLKNCNRIPSDNNAPPLPTTFIGETDSVDRVQRWVELERELMIPESWGDPETKTLAQRRIRVATMKNLEIMRAKKLALCKCLSYALSRRNSGREHGQGAIGNEQIRLILSGMKKSWYLPIYLSSPAVLKLLSCNLEAGALVPLVSGLEKSEKEEVLKRVCEMGLTTMVEAVLVSGFEITSPLLWQTLLPEALKKAQFDLAKEILIHPKTDVKARLAADWGPVDFRPALRSVRWPGGEAFMTQLMRHPKIDLLRKPVVLKAIVDLDPNAFNLLVDEGRPK